MAGNARKHKRPVIRIHGGKYRLVPYILDHIPPHRIYVEPFGGGGSVLIGKSEAFAEVYNDLDDEIVNVFEVMRDPWMAEQLYNALYLTPYSRVEYEKSYGERPRNQVEWARRTIIRSYMGYGSSSIFDNEAHGMRTQTSHSRSPGMTGFRTKRHVPVGGRLALPTGFRPDTKKSGTTPAHDWASYPEHIMGFVHRLRAVVIENRPAIEIMKQHDSVDTCHFVDPPYPLATRGRGRTKKGGRIHTYRHELTDEDHRELLAFLIKLKGYVVLCSYPNEIYTELLIPAGWRCVSRTAYADQALKRTEVLWLNPRVLAWRDSQLPGLVDELAEKAKAKKKRGKK